MNFRGNRITSKCTFYFVLIFTIFMVDLPDVEALSKYQTLIKTVYVDFETNTLTIVGDNLQYKTKIPEVTLGEDTLSLISYAPNVIEANLPVSFVASPGDYLLTVTARENRDKKYDAYSLTIGSAGLEGPQGIQGEPGPQGEQGIQGEIGPQGTQGIQGETGLHGAQGIQGVTGPKGDTGEAGSRGLRGYQGPQGLRGEQGLKGETGAKGNKGDQGETGTCTCPFTEEYITQLNARIVLLEGGGTARFTDMGDGTIRDNKTRLIWLKNANAGGMRHWHDALEWAGKLCNGQYGLEDGSVAGEWRIPTKDEWMNMIDLTYTDPVLTNTIGNGHWKEGDVFELIQMEYWTSTIDYEDPKTDLEYIWTIRLEDGQLLTRFTCPDPNVTAYSTWPVRTEH